MKTIHSSTKTYCYKGLSNYLSTLSGLPANVKTIVKKNNYSPDAKWILNGEQVGPLTIAPRLGVGLVLTNQHGSNRSITKENRIDYPLDTVFDEIYMMLPKPIEEFNIPIHKAGQIKYDEGGGWYSKQPVVRVNQLYFIDVHCNGGCGCTKL